MSVAGPAKPITISNNGGEFLNVTNIAVIGEFSETNNCQLSIPPNGSCTIEASLNPTEGFFERGTIDISSNATLVPAVVQLTGTGQDFMFEGGAFSVTAKQGKTAKQTFTLKSQNGFDETVTMSCSGMPINSSCVIVPQSFKLDGSQTVKVLLETTAPSSSGFFGSWKITPWRLELLNVVLCAIGCLFLWGVMWRGEAFRGRRAVVSCVLVGIFGLTLLACGGSGGSGGNGSSGSGGSGSPGTPIGAYVIIVTAKSVGTLSHGAEFTLNVQ